jgi:hypothetical protein
VAKLSFGTAAFKHINEITVDKISVSKQCETTLSYLHGIQKHEQIHIGEKHSECTQ